jgi:hypothetical protein
MQQISWMRVSELVKKIHNFSAVSVLNCMMRVALPIYIIIVEKIIRSTGGDPKLYISIKGAVGYSYN